MKIISCSLALAVSILAVDFAPVQAQGRIQPKKEKEQPKAKEKVYEVTAEGVNIDSNLNDKDVRDADRKQMYSKVFLVKLAKGKTYQIDMMSQNFDCYLRLEDSGKKQLAEDDDSGDDTDAQIIFTAPEDGVYRVITTSFDEDEMGAFKLRIQQK